MADERETGGLRGWHLQRNVSVSMIALLLFNLAGGVWWIAQSDARIERLEDEMQSQQMQLNSMVGVQNQIVGRLVKIETILERIERAVDRRSGAGRTFPGSE